MFQIKVLSQRIKDLKIELKKKKSIGFSKKRFERNNWQIQS